MSEFHGNYMGASTCPQASGCSIIQIAVYRLLSLSSVAASHLANDVQGQIMMLVNCLAESQGIKRRERVQLINQIEADLRELR